MAIFNSKLLVYQRVTDSCCVPHRCQVARWSLAFSSLMESMASWVTQWGDLSSFPMCLDVFLGLELGTAKKPPGKLQEKLAPCRIATSIASSATRQLGTGRPQFFTKPGLLNHFEAMAIPVIPQKVTAQMGQPFFSWHLTQRSEHLHTENRSSHAWFFKLFMRMENYTLNLWNHQSSSFSKLQWWWWSDCTGTG